MLQTQFPYSDVLGMICHSHMLNLSKMLMLKIGLLIFCLKWMAIA